MTDELENRPNSGAAMTISQIIKAVMSLAADAELCALFINCCEAITARIFLKEMRHKQPSKPIQTDKTTTLDVVNNNIVSKRLKSLNMIIN